MPFFLEELPQSVQSMLRMLESRHLKLTLQAVDDDLQMQLAHALNDRLVGLIIAAVAERWVLWWGAVGAKCPGISWTW